jgi:two-component system OmpR family sensor kinase
VSRAGALARFGRGLFFRVYVYQIVIVLMVLGATAILSRRVIEPGKEKARDAVTWISEWSATQMDEPTRLQRELDSMQRRFPIRVTVYRADATVVARTGQLLPALDANTAARLEHEDSVEVADEAIAVGRRGVDGRLIGYGITSVHLLAAARAERYLSILGIILVVFALGNVPMIRSIARPLVALSSAARAFGGGDMRARANLRRRDEIGDLARAFDDMADAVEASRRAEKELLANVSHELRTPLARMRVVHELAVEKFPAVAQRYMAEIAEDLGELERLIDDIIRTTRLDLVDARGGNASPTLRLGPLRVGEFVEALAKRFGELHPDRPVTVEVDYEPSIRADGMMLKRAVSNVLDNAHAYSTPGLAISISVAQDIESGTVDIRITDPGPGIAAADLPHVLTPFFRADQSRSRNTGGVGLGLSLTRRIIESHGGTLRIRSSPEVGTTVTMAMPLRAEAPNLL